MSYAGLPAGFTVAETKPKSAYAGLPEGFAVQGASEPSTIVDALKGFGSGVLQNLNTFLGDSGPLQTNENDSQFAQSHLPAAEVMSAVPGSTYQTQTTPGKYFQTGGQFAPFALGGEGALLPRLLSRAVLPAVVGETAGLAAKGMPYEGVARVAGEMVGGSPAAVSSGARIGAKALAKGLADMLPEQEQKLVSQYEAMGGNLRPGQYSPSSFMRQGDAVIADTPWPRAAGFAADSSHAILPSQQADQFNTLLSKTFGENAPRLTDEVIQKAEKRIGGVYETVLPRNNVTADEGLLGDIAKVESNVAEAAPAMDPPHVTRMAAVINRIKAQVSEGGITGKQYQTYRQRGGILDELAGSDSPVLQRAATDIRGALDDAFIRQAQGTDGQLLQTAKEQFRNLQVLKPLAAKAPAGNISPGLVLGAVNKEFGSPGAAGDLGTLARVGSAFLKAQPSSGTAERSVWRALINKPFSEGIPAVANAAISLPVSALASRTLNKSINSPEMRAQLLAKVLQKRGTQ